MKNIIIVLAFILPLTLTIKGQQLEQYVTRKINGKDFIIYNVKPSDTWESIALKFKIKERNLIDANKQTNGSLKDVLSIKVPAEGVSTVQTKNTVKEAPVELNSLPKFGDDITTKHKNNNSKPKIFGQELRTEYKGANSLVVYKIGTGDKIENLAQYFNCTISDIKTRNNLINSDLVTGKIIKIPVQTIANVEITPTDTTKTKQLNEEVTVKSENTVIEKQEKDINEEVSENEISENNNDEETIIGNLKVIKKLGKYYIKHSVISGEDLGRIAKEKYSTSNKIIATNNLKTNKVKTGQLLLIPTTKQILFKLTGLNIDQLNKKEEPIITKQLINKNNEVSDVKEKPQDKSIVTSQIKDTSERFKWGDVINSLPNKIDTNNLKTIQDNAKNLAINEVHANANSGDTKINYTHIVKEGETLESIAKKYKISPSDIANWNNLYQNRVRVGQDLIVNLARARKPYLAINSVSPENQKEIKKSEGNDRIKYIEEKGLCLLNNDNMIGVHHAKIPVGTLVLITSTENFKKLYVRITGTLNNSSDKNVIIQIDKNIAKQLAFNSELSNVLISYSIIE